MVDLLLSLGERLGREEAINVLTDTLQGFFSCFSSVHSNEEETQLWGTPHNSNKRLNRAASLNGHNFSSVGPITLVL